jgi:hypothetical protein
MAPVGDVVASYKKPMENRRILSSWKEIAAYLNRGVRTVQRWEASYKLPVRRPKNDVLSVFAFADELDAWLERSKPKSHEYVRPTVIVVDVITPNALSDLKLVIETAKFNVLTAFNSGEALATARKYDVDAFVIDSVILDVHPNELTQELRRLYPAKLLVLVGDDSQDGVDAVIPQGNPALVVEYLMQKFGQPRID